jgi:hypothetical protein
MMRAKLWLMLAVALVIGGGVALQAFASDGGKPKTAVRTTAVAKHPAAKKALTPAQKAARKRILATAAFLKENDLNCGCQHHFPAAKS